MNETPFAQSDTQDNKPKCSGCDKQFSFLPFRYKGKGICFSCKGRLDIQNRTRPTGYVQGRSDAEISSTTPSVGNTTVQKVYRKDVEDIFADMI